MAQPEIVLLGGPNSGKTHFAGQLYGRLKRNPGALRLRPGGTPTDLTALENVLHSLENGHAAEHTDAAVWAEIVLPIVDSSGGEADLRWPDYGGEQLRTVSTRRAVTEAWQMRLRAATGWIVLIRLNAESTYKEDAMKRLVRPGDEVKQAASVCADNWDANAHWVELLQMLLHVGGHGTVQRLYTPKLAVMLSCYDALDVQGKRPDAVLAEYLPLVSAFIQNVWTPDAVRVWGLSSLGKHLDKLSHDDDFIDEGPEKQGWIVAPEGGVADPDLTRPISWLLQHT